MSGEQTIRQHLEAIQRITNLWERSKFRVLNEHAVAALNLLDEAEREFSHWRTNAQPTDRVLVPDPLPSGSSMPATPHETKESRS